MEQPPSAPLRFASSTALELGARGRLDGVPFTLEGRTCVRGRRGALWNEWNVRFEDGRTLFLAEAGGSFTIYEEGSILPSHAEVLVGAALDPSFIVVERGEAVRVARWGAVDEAPSSYAYVDISGRGRRAGELATIDYGSEPPRVFVGRKVTLAELGLTPRSGPVRLIAAPEVSRPKGVETWLDVGDVGEIGGMQFRVVGMVSRSTGANEEDRVRWDEYLLVEAVAGFRWLVMTDGHWSLVETIDVGRVEEDDGSVVLDGVTYEPLSLEGVARVDWATGELPWEIGIGDTSNVKDFVHPPWILTREWTADELTWSRGTYLAPDAIAKAFGKRPLPRPTGRAPNQI